jgi:hypothetical protein
MNNQTLLSYLNRVYEEGGSFQKTQQEKYQQMSDYYKGLIWRRGRPPYKVDIVINHVKEILTRKVAMMTDVLPQVEITPNKYEELWPVCEILKNTITALWQEHDWSASLEEFLYFDQIFGTAFIETAWDSSLDWGEGDINIIVGDPRTYRIDPFIMKANKINEAEYIIHEYFRPTSLLKQQYPDKAELIKPYYDVKEEKKTSFLHKLLQTLRKTEGEPAAKFAIERSLVKKFWIKDRTTRDGNGELLYPTGRFVKTVGDVILDDEPNLYWDGRFPFDMLDWQFDPDSAFGISEVEDLAPPFKYYNKLIALILENIILSVNTIWTGDIDALTPSEREKLLRNKPGEYIGHRPGKPILRQPPPPLPASMLDSVGYLRGILDDLSGMSEVSRGKKGSITSGIAIESLATLGQSLIRYQARRLERLLNNIGQKLIARIFQFYTDDRLFYLSGPSKGLEQFKYIRAQLIEPLLSVYKDELSKKVVPPAEQSIYIAKKAFKDFRFIVTAGSTLAMTKVQRAQLALVLRRLGIIDDEAVLDILEFPNKTEILQRKQQKEQETPQKQQLKPTSKVKIPEFKSDRGASLRRLKG